MRSPLLLTTAVAIATVSFAAAKLNLARSVHAREASTAETPAPSGIEKYVNSFDQKRAKPTAVGFEFWFADKDLADGKTLKMSVVGPHLATHAPHSHPEDEFFLVLEGEAELFLAGERKKVGPMTSFYAPSNVEHGIRNLGDKELRYLVIKQYPKDAPNAAATPPRK